MIGCQERGFSFTRALLGLAADELHLCGDPSAISVVQDLLAATKDSFQVEFILLEILKSGWPSIEIRAFLYRISLCQSLLSSPLHFICGPACSVTGSLYSLSYELRPLPVEFMVLSISFG